MSHTDDDVSYFRTVAGATELTHVEDDEVLFRRVLLRGGGYVAKSLADHGHYELGDGVAITSQAFADREAEPSVDRERMCPAQPKETWTQDGDQNGVAWLITRAVRGIDSVVMHDQKGTNLVQTYDVDVRHRPIDAPGSRNNPAHSVVCTNPHCMGHKRALKKLREGLARLAAWKILPADVRGAKG